jgi:hypothetical protein
MPSGSGKKKSQLKIAGSASLLNTPHTDTAAAGAAARSLQDALQELIDLIQKQQRSSTNPRFPAGVLPHVGTLLQTVSWLTRGLLQGGCPLTQHGPLVQTVYAQAVFVGHQCLNQRDKLTLEQLRPALRPCPEDGATPGGWLNSSHRWV